MEDEKSVDTLQNLGFTATTTFGGVRSFSKFSKKYAEQIKKANLVIIEILTLVSFKKQLSKMNYCKFYNKPTCFHVANTYNGTKKTFSADVLVVDNLKKNNIDVNFMVD